MAWKAAKAISALFAEVNRKWPKRKKGADGIIGDTSHSARKSDHNPDSRGIVHAGDITHDPPYLNVHHEVAEKIVKNKDRRLKYAISKGRIASYYPVGKYKAYEWRPYSGSNRHDHHAHISLRSGEEFENDTRAWLDKGGTIDGEDDLVGKVADDINKKVDTLLDSVGLRFPKGPTIQKALVKQDPTTKRFLEHLDVLQSKLDELFNVVGELADELKRLADKVDAE